MKKIILSLLLTLFLTYTFSYQVKVFPQKLSELGYSSADFLQYEPLIESITTGNIPKAFVDKISKFSSFQAPKLLDYYSVHLLGHSIIHSLNIVNHPTFLTPTSQNYPALTIEEMLLVNQQFGLSANYQPSNLVIVNQVAIIKRPNETMQLEKSALRAYQLLYQAMLSFHFDCIVYSAFRPYEKQLSLWENSDPLNRLYLARPGHSEHQTGLAIDIATTESGLTQYFENTQAFNFLINHAHEFGFILRYPKDKEHITGYPYEPWHYRYVGLPHAQKIHEEKLCLEEYLFMYYPLPVNAN